LCKDALNLYQKKYFYEKITLPHLPGCGSTIGGTGFINRFFRTLTGGLMDRCSAAILDRSSELNKI